VSIEDACEAGLAGGATARRTWSCRRWSTCSDWLRGWSAFLALGRPLGILGDRLLSVD